MKGPENYQNVDGKEVPVMHTGKSGVRVIFINNSDAFICLNQTFRFRSESKDTDFQPKPFQNNVWLYQIFQHGSVQIVCLVVCFGFSTYAQDTKEIIILQTSDVHSRIEVATV